VVTVVYPAAEELYFFNASRRLAPLGTIFQFLRELAPVADC